jgi:hypothetical protein
MHWVAQYFSKSNGTYTFIVLLFIRLALKCHLLLLLALGMNWIGPFQNSTKIFSKLIQIFLSFISHQSFCIIIQIKNYYKIIFFIQNILIFFLTSIKSTTISVYFFKFNPLPNTTIINNNNKRVDKHSYINSKR